MKKYNTLKLTQLFTGIIGISLISNWLFTPDVIDFTKRNISSTINLAKNILSNKNINSMPSDWVNCDLNKVLYDNLNTDQLKEFNILIYYSVVTYNFLFTNANYLNKNINMDFNYANYNKLLDNYFTSHPFDGTYNSSTCGIPLYYQGKDAAKLASNNMLSLIFNSNPAGIGDNQFPSIFQMTCSDDQLNNTSWGDSYDASYTTTNGQPIKITLGNKNPTKPMTCMRMLGYIVSTFSEMLALSIFGQDSIIAVNFQNLCKFWYPNARWTDPKHDYTIFQNVYNASDPDSPLIPAVMPQIGITGSTNLEFDVNLKASSTNNPQQISYLFSQMFSQFKFKDGSSNEINEDSLLIRNYFYEQQSYYELFFKAMIPLNILNPSPTMADKMTHTYLNNWGEVFYYMYQNKILDHKIDKLFTSENITKYGLNTTTPKTNDLYFKFILYNSGLNFFNKGDGFKNTTFDFTLDQYFDQNDGLGKKLPSINFYNKNRIINLFKTSLNDYKTVFDPNNFDNKDIGVNTIFKSADYYGNAVDSLIQSYAYMANNDKLSPEEKTEALGFEASIKASLNIWMDQSKFTSSKQNLDKMTAIFINISKHYSPKNNIGLIVGSVVGAFSGAALISGIIIYGVYRKKEHNKKINILPKFHN